jgi:hypothetical protein
MWFTGINYYKLAVEKDRDSIFTTITTIWKAGFKNDAVFQILSLALQSTKSGGEAGLEAEKKYDLPV